MNQSRDKGKAMQREAAARHSRTPARRDAGKVGERCGAVSKVSNATEGVRAASAECAAKFAGKVPDAR